MTEEERTTRRDESILDYLDKVIKCCPHPNYDFEAVVPFSSIHQELCPTCGQEIK